MKKKIISYTSLLLIIVTLAACNQKSFYPRLRKSTFKLNDTAYIYKSEISIADFTASFANDSITSANLALGLKCSIDSLQKLYRRNSWNARPVTKVSRADVAIYCQLLEDFYNRKQDKYEVRVRLPYYSEWQQAQSLGKGPKKVVSKDYFEPDIFPVDSLLELDFKTIQHYLVLNNYGYGDNLYELRRDLEQFYKLNLVEPTFLINNISVMTYPYLAAYDKLPLPQSYNRKQPFSFCGNTAELIQDIDSIAVGGSFRDSLSACSISHKEPFVAPNYWTGFRIVFILTKKKH